MTNTHPCDDYLADVLDAHACGPAVRRLAARIAPVLVWHPILHMRPRRTSKRVSVPVAGEILAAIAASRALLPEDVWDLADTSGAAVLLDTLPTCDVCGDTARYDGVAYQRLFHPRGTLCHGCWSYRGPQRFGWEHSSYLAILADLSAADRGLIDAVTAELAAGDTLSGQDSDQRDHLGRVSETK